MTRCDGEPSSPRRVVVVVVVVSLRRYMKRVASGSTKARARVHTTGPYIAAYARQRPKNRRTQMRGCGTGGRQSRPVRARIGAQVEGDVLLTRKTLRRRRLLSSAAVDQYVQSVVSQSGLGTDSIDECFRTLVCDVAEASRMEAQLSHPRRNSNNLPTVGEVELARTRRRAQHILLRCREARVAERLLQDAAKLDQSDDALLRATRFTDELFLAAYANHMLRYVPRIVNVVSLATAVPVAGSGTRLPLDLKKIATHCKSAYYAPRRFAAVQLAFDDPRCRVLIFHTGRLVGTGTCGVDSARLVLLMAQEAMRKYADIWVSVRDFKVINTVAAVDLKTMINCDQFANEHTDAAHFDRSSFVGLAWRPPGYPICVEAYATGKLNLPGAKDYQSCIDAFAELVPELLKHRVGGSAQSSTASTADLVAGGHETDHAKEETDHPKEEVEEVEEVEEDSEEDEDDNLRNTKKRCLGDDVDVRHDIENEITDDLRGTEIDLFSGWS